MDYTLSPDFVTHPGTGHRMHSDTAAITTEVTARDMNSVLWSLMEIVQASGLTAAQFDAATPATYTVLKGALDALYAPLGTGASPGDVKLIAGATAPAGWIKCNGAAISRTTYAALFSKIGTVHGAGDGSTTFNVPDMRGVFVRGLDDGRGLDAGRTLGSYQADAQQNITGQFGQVDGGVNFANGVFGTSATAQTKISAGVQVGSSFIDIDASRQIRVAAEVRPKSVALVFCIKY
jgi:microcystin-dependent protein